MPISIWKLLPREARRICNIVTYFRGFSFLIRGSALHLLFEFVYIRLDVLITCHYRGWRNVLLFLQCRRPLYLYEAWANFLTELSLQVFFSIKLIRMVITSIKLTIKFTNLVNLT